MGNWEPVEGYAIGIAIEVDPLSLFFGLLVAIAVTASCIYSFQYIKQDDARGSYFTLYLMLSGGVMGIVLSGDPLQHLRHARGHDLRGRRPHGLPHWNPNAREAAFKYLVVGSVGSTCSLLGTGAGVRPVPHAEPRADLRHPPGQSQPHDGAGLRAALHGLRCKSFMFPFHPIAADAHRRGPEQRLGAHLRRPSRRPASTA